jgi:Ca2+-binding RTX toxin-like protein
MPTGTSGNDDFTANAGSNDTFYGLEGDDTLHFGFGTGADVYKGGLGVDLLYADVPLRHVESFWSWSLPDPVIPEVSHGYVFELTDGAQAGFSWVAGGSFDHNEYTGWETFRAADTSVLQIIRAAFSVTGGGGNEAIGGSNAGQTLNGAGGNDVIYGNGGADSLIGDAGVDYLSAGADDGASDSFNGGADNDTVSYSGAAGGVTLNLLAGTAFGASIGSDTLTGIELAVGSMFNDYVFGTNDHNTLWGMGGHDSVYGLLGNDLIFGEAGNDVLIGASGADALHGDDGADYAYGGDDPDVATGGAGLDVLLGENGADALSGGADQDYLFGGAENDTLSGDDGVDVLFGESGGDFLHGGAGIDHFYGGDGGDTGNGGDDGDIFIMEGGADTISGEAGNDFVYGGLDNDAIFGGAGVDVILGETGNDYVDGGTEVDYVFLGGGDDTFAMDALTPGLNVDVLHEFTPGAASGDVLRLLNTGWTTIAQVNAAMIDTGNGYSILTLDADTQIWMIGILPGALVAGDAVFT